MESLCFLFKQKTAYEVGISDWSSDVCSSDLKGANKGAAVARLMAAPPFAGAQPIFIGDDRTDEDGFVAVATTGGHGILVGAPRPTAADYRLADPEAVHRWLML